MRRRGESLRLSVFKGRDARLNRAIFEALALKGPSTVYEIYRHVRTRRVFRRKLYSVVNRRVRSLVHQGYLRRVGERTTKAGFKAALYGLSAKAYLAILLSQINLEEAIERADEETLTELIITLLKLMGQI